MDNKTFTELRTTWRPIADVANTHTWPGTFVNLDKASVIKIIQMGHVEEPYYCVKAKIDDMWYPIRYTDFQEEAENWVYELIGKMTLSKAYFY